MDPCDRIREYMCVEELEYIWFEWLKGRRRWFAVEAEFWMNSGSAAEGSFGRRTSCMVAWLPQLAPECFCMFGSVWGIRPPKVPPKVLEFRLWRGHSAAEPAAESVLSSFLLHALQG